MTTIASKKNAADAETRPSLFAEDSQINSKPNLLLQNASENLNTSETKSGSIYVKGESLSLKEEDDLHIK